MRRFTLGPWTVAAAMTVALLCYIGCTPDSATCVRALTAGRYSTREDGSIRELDILIDRGDDESILDVLVCARDKRVIEEASHYIRDVSRFRSEVLLDASQQRITKARGALFFAEILVFRRRKKGLRLLHPIFREWEGKIGDASSEEDRQTFRKCVIGLQMYLLRITGNQFKSSTDYAMWLSDELPKRAFGPPVAPASGRPPRLVRDELRGKAPVTDGE